MSFDELLAQLDKRFKSGDPTAVMDVEALADLQRLRLLARPSTPGRHSREENIRLAIAEWAAIDLHTRRWTYLLGSKADPNPDAARELYQAALASRSLAMEPSRLFPGALERAPMARELFGPEPDAEVQGTIAYFLLANAPPEADRNYHAFAVDLLRIAAAGIPPDHPHRSEWQRLLSFADQRREPSSLDWERIQTDEMTRWLFTADGPEPTITSDETLARWDEVTGRLRERLRQAITESRPELLGEDAMRDAAALVRALRQDSVRLRSPQDLRHFADAFRLIGSLHNVRAAGGTFEERHGDLARAILFLAPLDLTGSRVPQPAGLLLGPEADAEAQAHFATLFLTQWSTTPDPALIAASIMLLLVAISSLPADASEQAGYLGNLAVGFGRRHGHTGTLGDLEQAIVCAEQCLALTPPDDPNLARRRSRTAALYQHMARRTRMLEDYERAVHAHESALAAASSDDPNLALYLMNLGAAYGERTTVPQRKAAADAVADIADLNKAIELLELAIVACNEAISTVDSVTAASTLRTVAENAPYNLGVDYLRRYRATRDPADLERAVATHERTLTLVDIDDPVRLKILSHLSIAYEELYVADATRVSTATLHDLARQIDALAHGLPHHRIWAYRNTGSLAEAVGCSVLAADLTAKAVRLLPLVISPENEWEDQQQRIGEHQGLLAEAVGAQCRAGDPQGAVDISEFGRDIVLPAFLGSPPDLARLEEHHPDLATQFHRLRRTLSRPHGVLLGDTSEQILGHTPYQIGQRLQWEAAYNGLLATIHRLPGFADFLAPANQAELQAAAGEGVVVLVNVDRRGGDAVIISTEGGPVHVPLPKLTLDDAIAHGHELLHAAHFGTGLTGALTRRRVLPQVLRWLWSSIVEPVLSRLPPQPRIWWMPTSLLTLFPLHAAGLPGQPDTLDLAVCSYTSTLRALAATQARRPPSVRRQLTVALEHAPGEPDLPGVVHEAETLHAAFPDAPHLRDHSATVNRVLAALPDATWAHFACHATADYLAPSRGGIRLHDGLLTIPDISALRLREAELVYLSACSTANRGVRHADESITLASAFQTAGFRHVVASLWRLDDASAAMVARAFYENLPDGPSADHAPHALRHVAIKLRTAHPDRPDLWAPLIHFGP